MTFSRSRTCGRAQNNFDRSGARRIAGPVIVGLALGALHFGSADAQEVIDTTPAWNGTASIAAWGVPTQPRTDKSSRLRTSSDDFWDFIALAHTNNQLSVATALQAVAEGTPKGTAGTIINILSGLDSE